VRLRELLLSQDFAAQVAGVAADAGFAEEEDGHEAFGKFGARRSERPRSRPAEQRPGLPFYFVELNEGRLQSASSSSTVARFRSAPLRGCHDGYGWIRVALGEDAQLLMPGKPALGGNNTAAEDAAIQRGEHHRLSLRLLQMAPSSGGQLVAESELVLPVGEVKEGAPFAYFGGHIWVPLMHASPDGPWMAVVGRALLSFEAVQPGGASAARLLRSLPLAPSGLLLPLYRAWEAPKKGDGTWPPEAATRAFAGEDLWSRLVQAEARPKAVSSKAFGEALEAAGAASAALGGSCPSSGSTMAGPTLVQEELSFLRATIAPLLADPEALVPYPQLLHWLGIRSLARRVLPVAAGLLGRLRQLDGGGGARRRAATGTVPLAALQSALRAELSSSGGSELPAALWQLLAQRPQWLLASAGGGFCGHEHFDYLVFLWDLNIAAGGFGADGRNPIITGIPAAQSALPRSLPPPRAKGSGGFEVRSLQAREEEPPAASSAGSGVNVVIHRALHLPQIRGGPPSAFVSYGWRCGGDDLALGLHGWRGGEEAVDEETGLGITEVVERSFSPCWDHSVDLRLPDLLRSSGSGDALRYPEAYKHLSLELRVWHADKLSSSSCGEDLLIGA
ncbi:unnamed protein product, partial [Polarella glacialis]